MFVLKTSSPKIRRGAPKKAPRTTVPSSRTRDPSISLDPHPIFDSVYERLPRARNIRRPCRLRGSREIEIVQPRDHLVPVTPLPIDAATGGAAPKCVMPNPDSLRDEPFHVLGHHGDQDLVAERATGERIDESEGQLLGDFADLLLQIVRADLHRPGHAGRESFVPREEDPILGPRSLNQGSIRSRLRVCGVVSHEPQPASEAPEHVVAEDLHGNSRLRASMTTRRARCFPRRKAGCRNPAFHSSPPSSSDTTKRLAMRAPR